jgi:hypothetical protein
LRKWSVKVTTAFARQPAGLASRQHPVDQALLRANHLPVNNDLPARDFQVLW